MVSQIREQIQIKTKYAFRGFFLFVLLGYFLAGSRSELGFPRDYADALAKTRHKAAKGQEEAVNIG